jgi:hypothetical protein
MNDEKLICLCILEGEQIYRAVGAYSSQEQAVSPTIMAHAVDRHQGTPRDLDSISGRAHGLNNILTIPAIILIA